MVSILYKKEEIDEFMETSCLAYQSPSMPYQDKSIFFFFLIFVNDFSKGLPGKLLLLFSMKII